MTSDIPIAEKVLESESTLNNECCAYKKFWSEQGFISNTTFFSDLATHLRAFAKFNGCEQIDIEKLS